MESSRMEQALLNQLRRRSFHPEARRQGWRTLNQWPKAYRCRLAVEAILSQIFTPESELCNLAHEWIDHQIDHSLIAAVALVEATNSEIHRKVVLDEIFDRHNIQRSEEAQKLWQRIRQGEPVTWSEIKGATSLTDWEAVPPADRYDLYGACEFVRAQSNLDQIIHTAYQFAQMDNLTDSPNLISKVLDIILIQPKAKAEKFFADHFDRLSGHFLAKLTVEIDWVASIDGRLHVLLDYNSDQRREKELCSNYRQNLIHWTTLLAQHLGDLEPDTQHSWVNQLTSTPIRPWVAIAFPEIVPCITKWDWSFLLPFLIEWYKFTKEHDRNDWIGKWRHDMRVNLNLVCTLTDCLSAHPEVAEDYLIQCFLPNAVNDSVEAKLLERLLPEGVVALESKFATYLAEAESSPHWLMELFVKKVGYEVAKPVLLVWFQHPDNMAQIGYLVDAWMESQNKAKHHRLSSEDKIVLPSLFEYAINEQIPLLAGCLESSQALATANYQLQLGDLESKEVMAKLLGLDPDTKRQSRALNHNKKDIKYIIQNRMWLEVIISQHRNFVGMWKVVLESVNEDDMKWIVDFISQVKWKEESEWQECICQMAWDQDTGYGASFAARSLVRLCQLWSPVHAELYKPVIREYLKDYDSGWYREFVNHPEAYFSLSEMLDLFFDTIFGKSVEPGKKRKVLHLSSPEWYKWLFPDEASLSRLRQWLMRHQHEIELEDWLQWAKHFGFSQDKAVAKAAWRALDKVTSHSDYGQSLAQLARSIIDPSYNPNDVQSSLSLA